MTPHQYRPFRYCPRCGIELEEGGRCPRCGERLVPRTVPAVGMAVVESGRILLVRRRWEPMVGHWALPAGFIEHDEDPAATARREVAEEFRTFETVGRVTYVAYQDDRDYHIVLEDPSAPGLTIVTELADTACRGAVMSPHLATLLTANASFRALVGSRVPAALVGMTLRVQGVGFYDFNHGQRGRSLNCLELHPIVSIEQVPSS